jgi:nitroreductase
MSSASDLLTALEWRYATKVFDPHQKIPDDTWADLEKSLILTPSSFGLQPWKFIVIRDQALREELVPHAWKQRQVADCSHLLVIAVPETLQESHIDANIHRMVEVRGGSADGLLGFRNMVAGFRSQLEAKGGLEQWAKLQAYIALGQFMLAASLLGIDTCPMEGFVPDKFDEILGLEKDGLTATVLCPAGYRSEDDRYASLPKVRFEASAIIEHR